MKGLRPKLPPGPIFLPDEPGEPPLPRVPRRPPPNVTPELRKVFLKAVERRRARKAPRTYSFSPIQMSLFNATALCDSPDILALFERLRSKPADIVSVSLKGGQFRELGRINSKGVIEPVKSAYKPNQVQITFEGSNVVNIFSNGIVRMTGKSPIESVVRMTERYTGPLEDVVVSNMSGQFRLNQNISLPVLQERFPSSLLGRAGRISYETEAGIRTVGLIYRATLDVETEIQMVSTERVRMSAREAIQEVLAKPKTATKTRRETIFAITFYNTGYIQFKGKLADAGDVVRLVREIFDTVPECIVKRFIEVPKKEPKERSYKTRSRNPPNPPDSFEGQCPPGQYCRPNAQGFPTCYKIPAINESSKRTVSESYKRAGVPIPAGVRQLFGLGETSTGNYDIKLVIEKQKYAGKTVEVLKVGGRQCYRLSEDQLESVARRLGVPGVRKGMGIAKMCTRLKQYAAEQAPLGKATNTRAMKPSFIIDGKAYYIIGNSIKGAQRRNGKPNPPRKCVTLPAETVRSYARAMGIDPTGKSKTKLCAEMQAFKPAIPLAPVVPLAPVGPVAPPVNAPRQKFINALQNKPYTEANINHYKSLRTPQQRAAFILRVRRRPVSTPGMPSEFNRMVNNFSRTRKGRRLPSEQEVANYRRRLESQYLKLVTRYAE